MPRLYSSTPALSFDDVLFVPQKSDIDSRSKPDLRTKLSRNIEIAHPVVATNMSTITEHQIMLTFWKTGSFAILHRFMHKQDFLLNIERFIQEADESDLDIPINAAISVGVKGEELDNGWLYRGDNITAVVVDVAHGDSQAVINTIQSVKQQRPDVDVIAGNVATRDGFMRLVEAGADGVRVGIGGGSACTTRLVTGHGLPTLASVIDCAEASQATGVPIIADGGIRESGDIVKALAFGASAVCVGNILAGTSDTPGDILELPNGRFKEYYGMSSKTAQERHKSGKRRGIAAEGIDRLIPYKGDTMERLLDIIGGVKSGLSYSGALTIEELRENAEYVLLSPGSMRESKFV